MPSIFSSKKSAKEVTVTTTEFDSNEDLDVVFERALKRYQTVTGRSLAQAANRNFEDISQDIWTTIKVERSVLDSKTLTVIDKVSTCLAKFGSAFASVASAGLPATGQCWNAFGLILGAASEYKAIFDGFISLMERIAAFLENLNVFLEKKQASGEILDPVLRKKTYEILAKMLDLLAESYRLTQSKRKQFGAMVGVFLFSSDGGVKENLIEFENSMKDLIGMEVTAILANVENLAANMLNYHDEIIEITETTLRVAERIDQSTADIKASQDRLEASRSKRLQEKKAKEALEVIAEALQIKTYKDKQSQPWSDRHHNICRSRVSGTGKWLLEMPEYLNWSHTSEPDTKVMTLIGDKGFGKSYACSHIIDDLHQKYTKGHLSQRSERVCIAYYYFEKAAVDSKGGSRDAVKQTTASMLSAIIYQWAQLNPEYARAVSTACDRSDELSKASDIWHTLVTGLADSMHGTYFIVLDGYERDEDEEDDTTAFETLKRMLLGCTSSDSKIRAFISGPGEHILPLIPGRVLPNARIQLGTSLPQFGLIRRTSSFPLSNAASESTRNELDLVAFAATRIDEICKKEPDLARIMKDPQLQAAETLARGVRGDYSSLISKLDQILTSEGDDEELRAIVDRASESKKDSLRRIVDDLHSTLRPWEVEELNALLPWLFGLIESAAEIGLLQNAISLTTGKGRGLQSHVKNRFRPLLRLNKQRVVELWSPDLREMLHTLTSDEEAMKNSDSAIVHPSEVKIISRVVKTFCGDELYDKFEFDSFFKTKLDDKPVRIKVESEAAGHILIVQTCLQALCEKSKDDQFKDLRQYGGCWFQEHLTRIKLEDVDAETVQSIGRRLVTLFWDPALVDAWWASEWVPWLRYDFIERETLLEPIVNWLKLAFAGLVSSCTADQAQWLQAITNGKRYELFSKVACKLAERWFGRMRCFPADVKTAYGMYFKMTHGDEPLNDAGENISVEQAEQFVSWAKQNVVLAIPNAQWKYRLGALHKICGHYNDALILLLEAIDEGLDHWGLLLCAAQCHVLLGQHAPALESLHRIREQSSELQTDSIDVQVLWDTIIPLEAECHLALDDVGSAVSCYQSVLEHELDEQYQYVHARAVSKLFELWNERQQHDEIIAKLQSWCDAHIKSRGIAYWLSRLASQNEIHAWISVAAQHTDNHQLVTQAYVQAIESLSSDDTQTKRNALVDLRYYYAAMMLHSSSLQERHDQALDYLTKLVMESAHETETYAQTSRVVRGLSRYLLDKAVEHGIQQRPTPAVAVSYAKRFEDLVDSNLPVIGYMKGGSYDPILCVARMKVLAGETSAATELLKDKLRTALDDWPESKEDVSDRMFIIASALMIFEDDESAVTAWRLMVPGKEALDKHGEEEADLALAAAAPDPLALIDQAQKSMVQAPQVNGREAEIDTKTAVDGEDDRSTSNSQQSQGNGRPESAKVDENFLPNLTTFERFSCDGCDTYWRVIGDLYACKDCICVQFCRSCYEKLQAGQLRRLHCNKKHQHVYVPPFDRLAWERTPGDKIMIGDKIISRQEWLDKLRADWGLQQKSIDAHKQLELQKKAAARFIARRITKTRRSKMVEIVEQAQAASRVQRIPVP